MLLARLFMLVRQLSDPQLQLQMTSGFAEPLHGR